MLTIALWNLERSACKSRRIQSAQRSRLNGQRANLLLLTETHREMTVEGFHGHFSDANSRESGYPEVEAAAGILHDWDATPTRLPTTEKAHLALCLRFPVSPVGPLIVYCSIIPYRLWQVGPEVKAWQRHQESTQRQTADWKQLLTDKENAGYRLVVGGDFNQVLDGSRKYGNAHSLALLEEAFSTDLECVTRDDYSESVGRHGVDHLALDRRMLGEYGSSTVPWSGTHDGLRMSDHNGITVTLRGKA